MYEKRELLERIAANYDEALTRLEARGDRIARVDGSLAIEAVHGMIRDLVFPMVGL